MGQLWQVDTLEGFLPREMTSVKFKFDERMGVIAEAILDISVR